MFKKMCHLLKNRKGFTLVELMVVVVIIGILTAVAVPMFSSSTASAQKSAHNANVRILEGAASQYITDCQAASPATTPVFTTWDGTTSIPTTGTWKPYLNAWPQKVGTRANYKVTYDSTANTITVTPAAE